MGRDARHTPPKRRGGFAPEMAWGLFGAAGIAFMFMAPGWETVPFHFVWISLTVLYGVRVWSWRPTLVVLALVMAATTVGELHPGVAGEVELTELVEVPLMAAVFLAMVWHARRRQYALEQLAAAQNREREFLRDAAHQLRTPITVARGHAELIRLAGEPDAVRDDADVVVNELQSLSTISDRLLTIAMASHPDFLTLRPVCLDDWLRNAAARWRPCADRAWELQMDGSVRAEVDPDRLAVAVDALIENAVRHTGPGDRIVLGLRHEPGWAVFSVADSGVGIPDDMLDRVFDRFASSTDGPRGTGLGLPMVRAIADAHHGTATVTSTHGAGTRAELRIPAGDPPARATWQTAVPVHT